MTTSATIVKLHNASGRCVPKTSRSQFFLVPRHASEAEVRSVELETMGTLRDLDLYSAGLEFWAEMYVDGTWTLEQFESHADTIRTQLIQAT